MDKDAGRHLSNVKHERQRLAELKYRRVLEEWNDKIRAARREFEDEYNAAHVAWCEGLDALKKG